jgi:hypothetical protein
VIDAAAIQGLAKLEPLPAAEMRKYALDYPVVKWFEAADAGYRREYTAQAFAFSFSLQVDMRHRPYCWIAMGAVRFKRNKPPNWYPPDQWGSPFDVMVFDRLKSLIGEVGTGEISAHLGKVALTARKELSGAELERLSHVLVTHKVFCPMPT